ncbi:MAG: aminotransferase DegT [Candidatus Cloacimonadota bacterium]|nr:MAG: aminotransferase DegT [Candidatus Cloacimonadota bacterium]
MKINFINLQAQYQSYKEDIDREIHAVLDSSQYIMGPNITSLEEDLSNFVGCKHSIGCSSGTDALILALMAIDIKPGDEVITTPFTFIATAEAIAFLGGVPIFVDVDENTYNMDVYKVEKKITEKTIAIMPVSLFGQVCDMDYLNKLASKHNIYVIEDAAQSFGASYRGKRSCNLSTLACTSFFPAKPLGCYGDGGAVFSSDDRLARKIRIILDHGQTKKYTHSHIGINGRLDAIQASILRVKLKNYQEELDIREKVASRYKKELKNVIVPFVPDENTSVWAQFCIRVDNREAFLQKCMDKGVPTPIYYPIPLHLQEVFLTLGYKKGDFPICEKVSQDILALPMSAFLTNDEQSYVIGVINE